jgi:cell division protein ZapA
MPSTEPVRVTIFNQSYSLVATGDSGQIEELAQMVDDLMTSISIRAGNLDGQRTAVLACLHLADQLRALQQDLDQLRSRVDSKAKEFTMLLDGVVSVGAGT